MKITGDSELDGKVVVDDLNSNAIALQISNTNIGANARAISVDGMVEITAVPDNQNPTMGLKVTNNSNLSTSNALEVDGICKFKKKVSFEDDIISTLNSGGKIKVNDLNSNGNSIEAVNSDVSGNALKLVGNLYSQSGNANFNGDMYIENNITANKANDPMLNITNIQENRVALFTPNDDTGANASALKSEGISVFKNGAAGQDTIVIVQDENSTQANAARIVCRYGEGTHPTPWVMRLIPRLNNPANEHKWVAIMGDTDQAEIDQVLDVNGGTVLRGQTIITDLVIITGDYDDKPILDVTNASVDVDSLVLRADGKSQFRARTTDNPASIAINAQNESTNPDARALFVEGVSEIIGQTTGNPPSTALKVTNESANNGAKAIDANGTSMFTARDELDPASTAVWIINESANLGAKALVTHGQNIMDINPAGNPAETVLKIINTSTHADARGLVVDGKTDLKDVEADENIFIKSGSRGFIIVPDVNNGNDQSYACTLSNTSTHPMARALYATGNVEVVGDVEINGDLTVSGDIDAEGNLLVGATGAAGLIDSGGSVPTPRDLKVGSSAVTDNVVLSRVGQTIDMFGQARMNGNAIIMNNAANITNAAALGVVENPIGHGFGPSLDFVTGGVVRFAVDSSGGHNVP